MNTSDGLGRETAGEASANDDRLDPGATAPVSSPDRNPPSATIFIGGSRSISKLPPGIEQRLDTIIARGHRVIVGDAPGADAAVQQHLHEAAYDRVTVFHSTRSPRTNAGDWLARKIDAPGHLSGFEYHSVKDAAMARDADFGLMIWDGTSQGTRLNVERLTEAGKATVLFSAAGNRTVTIKTRDDWTAFLSKSPASQRRANAAPRSPPKANTAPRHQSTPKGSPSWPIQRPRPRIRRPGCWPRKRRATRDSRRRHQRPRRPRRQRNRDPKRPIP